MVFAYSKYVQTNLVGVLDLFDELLQAVLRADGPARLIESGGEAVNSYLHGTLRLGMDQGRPVAEPVLSEAEGLRVAEREGERMTG